MISFYYTKRHDKLVLSYFPYQNTDWVRRAFKENKEVIISKTFHFRKNDLLTMINEDQEVSYEFIFGKKDNDSFLIEGRILSCSRNLRIRQIPPLLNIDYFKIKHLDKKTSVFQLLDEQINSSIAEITIGDEQSGSLLTWEQLNDIINGFPNEYELSLYIKARSTQSIMQHLPIIKNYPQKLESYRRRGHYFRTAKEIDNAIELDIHKYRIILNQLEEMLEPEKIEEYIESSWQEQISKIILLLYPQYIIYLSKVRIEDYIGDKNHKEIDILLVNTNGNVDILEIKRPSNRDSILRKGTYRDNYIPCTEVTYTVMQIEKYIINLIKSGKKGEDDLNKKYKNVLPVDIKLQINSPKGFLILGREKNMNSQQIRDMEIVKRKYANIIDVVTYDDLIIRLKRIICSLTSRTETSI
ncbi:Shedu immune nuclease family protein [uncultured Parabacteroides sp.]|uniref:Shedu immune nuclease family protein n=1 Tax=uncultured Parabacteroides sp. TaxID=512312 RepID=UPI0025FD8D19|nr:Shedu immune nuclease family protein [uncultured Parabacteroides sp.]